MYTPYARINNLVVFSPYNPFSAMEPAPVEVSEAAPFLDAGNMLLIDRVAREYVDKKKGCVVVLVH